VRTTQAASVLVGRILVARIRGVLATKRRILQALAAHVTQARIIHRAKSLWAAATKSATVALGSGESSNPETADCQNG
jgi:hypothetical protein